MSYSVGAPHRPAGRRSWLAFGVGTACLVGAAVAAAQWVESVWSEPPLPAASATQTAGAVSMPALPSLLMLGSGAEPEPTPEPIRESAAKATPAPADAPPLEEVKAPWNPDAPDGPSPDEQLSQPDGSC